MSSVLVTGITGFIGSNLAKALVERGYDVYGLVRPCASRSLQPIAPVLDRVTLLTGDISNLQSVANAMKFANPDFVCHLAALTPVRYSFEHPYQYEQNNYLGTMNVAHALMELPDHKRRKLIAASTAEVYGIHAVEKPFTEDLPLKPSSPYAVSKAAGDMYLQMAARVYGLNCLVLRPSNTYGRLCETDFIVEYLITRMLREERVFVGAPDSIRDYIHVDDHIRGYLLSLERDVPPSRVYNIGSGVGIKNRDLAAKIAQIIGYDLSKGVFGSYPLGYPLRPIISDQPYLVLNANKAREELKWSPTVELDHGLERVISFWRKRVYSIA